MPNLTAVIGANTSKLVEEIKSAKYMLEKFVDKTKNAKESVEDNVSVTNEQVNAYKKVVKTLEQVVSGTMNTKQQQAALSSSVKELKIQWANLSNTAKSGEFGKMLSSTLVESQSALGQLTTQIKQAESELGNFSGGNVKRQLMDLTKNLTNLTAQYRAMSDAEKQSAAGQELAQKLSDLRERAGSLKDTVGDVQQEIKTLASDTPNLDVFNDLVGLSADALSTYSSIIAKVTGDEKSLKDAIATVMAVQSAANLLTKVTNALQSSSAIMLKVRAIQEKAAAVAINIKTAAEGKSVVVTKAATVAQRIFNAVAKANPYVLLATAILGAGAALVAFSRKSDEATEAEKKAQREAEELKARQEHLREQTEELNETSAKTTTKFYELQTQWKNLKTEAEKKKWIDDNKSAFSSLGISVNSVTTAESIFTKNTDAVCQALLARAVAAKKAEQAANDLIKLDKQSQEKSRKTGDYYVKAGLNDRVSVDERKRAGVNTLGGLSQKDLDKINANRRKDAQKQREERRKDLAKQKADIQKDYEESYKAQLEAEKKLASLGDKPKATGGGGGKNNKPTPSEPTYAKESLSDLEAQLSQLQKDYKDGLLPDLSKDNYKKAVKLLEDRIKDKKIELGLEVELPEGSLEKINKDIQAKQADLNLAVDNESRQKIQKEIDDLTKQKHDIEITLKPVVQEKDIEDIEAEISEHQINVQTNVNAQLTSGQHQSKSDKAQSNADNLKEELDFNKQIVKSHQEQYNLIKERQKLGTQLTSNEQKLVSIYEDAKDRVDALSESYKEAAKNANELRLNSEIKKKTWEGVKSGIGTLGDLNGAVMNVGGTWKNLTENWEDMSAFEQVTQAFDATISTIENVIGAYEAINDMIKLFGEISELSSAKKIAANSSEMASDQAKMAMESANTQTKIANDTAENTSTIGKLGVKEAGAIAGATESGASLPFPANLAAIAAGIAAVVAGFAMVFSCFADGGIVGNGSKIGDYNIARVNGGEMILNGTQQKRLFNLLNTDGGFTNFRSRKQDVNFVIKGKALKGTLRNYDGMKKKI